MSCLIHKREKKKSYNAHVYTKGTCTSFKKPTELVGLSTRALWEEISELPVTKLRITVFSEVSTTHWLVWNLAQGFLYRDNIKGELTHVRKAEFKGTAGIYTTLIWPSDYHPLYVPRSNCSLSYF